MQDDISTLDRLIDALDVRVSAFALLNISPGYRLCFSGSGAPVVHFVLTGEGLVELPDGSILRIRSGDVLVLPPAYRKAIRTQDEPFVDVRSIDRCRTGLTGLVRVDAGPEPAEISILCGVVGAGVLGCHGLFDGLTKPLRTDLRSVPFTGAAFAALRTEVATPTFASHALAGALMKACLVLVVRQHLDALLALYGVSAGSSQDQLRRTLLHVLERPGEPHSLASLGEVAGMSRTNFTRAFTAAFGSSPMAFVMKVRLHNAAELLTTTDLPVKMIAASAGLSRSHFSRAFRTAYGRDPLSFRADAARDRRQGSRPHDGPSSA